MTQPEALRLADEMERVEAMNEQIKKLLNKGYSPQAIAMSHGGPVGTQEYYDLLNQLEPDKTVGCPHCGELCFGTGDCNCQDK